MTSPATSHDPSPDGWRGLGLRRWHSMIPLVAAALVVLGAAVVSAGAMAGGVPMSLGGSVLGVLVMGAAWVLLPAPFGFAVATVTALSLLETATLGDTAFATVVGGTVGLQVATTVLLVVTLVVETTDPDWLRREGVLAVAVFGLAVLVVWEPLVVGDGYGTAAGMLAAGTGGLLYGLHRYALVRTGEVTHGD